MSVFAEFLVPVTSYPLSKVLADYPAASIEVDAIVPSGGSMHYVWVRGEGHDELVDDLESLPTIDDVEVVDDLPDRELVRFEWPTAESPLFATVEEVGARIAGAEGTARGWTIRVQFPDQDSVRAFYEACRRQAIDVRLRQLFDPDAPLVDDGFGLSDKQRETIEAAFRAGYFEVPRQATLQELADELGISEQGVSERLRRGLSSFLNATLDDGAADAGGQQDRSEEA